MPVTCDICGGSLMIDGDGQSATCQSCGMKHSIERVREKAHNHADVVLPQEPVVSSMNIEATADDGFTQPGSNNSNETSSVLDADGEDIYDAEWVAIDTQISEATGVLEIERERRKAGERDQFIAYYIFVDGKEADSIKLKEKKQIRLNAGLHTIQLKNIQLNVEWGTSKEISFLIRENEVTYAKCSAGGTVLWGAFSITKAVKDVVNKDNYINLEIL